MSIRWRGVAAGALTVALLGCDGDGDLPAPPADGPLALRVVFPAPHAGTPPGGAGYVIGSTGNGSATLVINGRPVPVHPGGGFLAYLPLPPDDPTLRLTATLGDERATHLVPLAARSPEPPVARGSLAVDGRSLTPREPVLARAGEPVRVAVHAPAEADVWVQGPAGRVPLRLAAGDGPDAWAAEVGAARLRGGAAVWVARGADTVRLPLAPVEVLDATPRWAELRSSDGEVGDEVAVRPAMPGRQRWLLLPGTRVMVTGRRGDATRVRLDGGLEAWADARDVRPLPDGKAGETRSVGTVRVRNGGRWSDVVIPLTDRPPHHVEVRGDTVLLTLLGTRAPVGQTPAGDDAGWVRAVAWEPIAADRVGGRILLAGPAFGHRVLWERGALVLRLRRPPRVDGAAPLRGRVIAVDAGHPPHGATGPTGLHEPVVTLAVARRVARLLRARGATVVLTRADDAAVALHERVVRAVAADADALVSIHVDAVPHEISPATLAGTATHFFHPAARPLAAAVQREMVGWMGLTDRGLRETDLAMVRPTWMPSVLTEGATLVIPEHEAALRTARFQDAYARGIADGLEAYFAALARRR